MRKCPILVLILTVFFICSLATGRERVVTTTADSGPGSLRWALQVARPGDVITFDPAVFPPDAPATIYPLTELPPITCGGVTIDASNAGVIIDGSRCAGDWNDGLQVYSGNNMVMGLQIVNFKGSGIAVCGRDARNNVIGGDRSIGVGPIGQGNLVSGNTIGIDVCDFATGNVIKGNLVGTDVTGEVPWGNKELGIFVEDGVKRTRIGPNNIVAYNNVGIVVSGPTALGNTITRNAVFGNLGPGISLEHGGNTELTAPEIFDFDLGAGTVTGSTCANCTVEIFSDRSNQGEIYEGQVMADENGYFTFHKGAGFRGPHLTTTATDPNGNTSQFSSPTFGMASIIQLGNENPKSPIERKRSNELADNRIGGTWDGFWNLSFEELRNILESEVLGLGLKRVRWTINNAEPHTLDDVGVDLTKPEFAINPEHDSTYTVLANNGVKITYILTFWEKENPNRDQILSGLRFQTEEQIRNYLDFIRFIVRHFKDRVEYYEIWNEPNLLDSPGQGIRVEDYINLVKRAVPVIRQEYPEAKIVVGSVTDLWTFAGKRYLFSILESDIIPLVDVIAWHPMYGTSPEHEFWRDYYYDYPSLVQEIKEVASSNGFRGEFEADELTWWTTSDRTDKWQEQWKYSNAVAAKYYARAIVMHLGMDVTAGTGGISERPIIFPTLQNLCTIMAGAEPANLPVEIRSDATLIKSYSFALQDGDYLMALWTDGVAVDDDPGTPATLVFPRLSAQRVIGIDVLYGVEQQLITHTEDGSLVIRDLLVKDYPIILRLTGVKRTAPSRSRVLDAQEYRPIYDVDGTFLKLENVREPKDAVGVIVTVKATVNGQEETIRDMVDIVDGKGSKDIRLGSLFDAITVKEVDIEY